MADTTVEAAAFADINLTSGPYGPYWVSISTGALIFLDTTGNPNARKTTDGGATWGAAVEAAAEVVHHFSCVFDQEVLGNSGDKAHALWLASDGNVRYAAYDISANAWSTPVTVQASVTPNVTSKSLNGLVITLARSGRLVAAWHNGDGAVAGSAESTDGGAIWAAITSLFEASSGFDLARHAYCNTGDDADVAIIYHDISANELSIKVHDDSANTVTETSIATVITSEGSPPSQRSSISTATRLSDGHVLLAAWSEHDGASADLLSWDLLINSVTSPTITAKANIITNTAEAVGSGILIDQGTNHVYCAYLRGSLYSSLLSAFYKKSTDGMATWSSETAMQENVEDDLRWVSSGFASQLGGRFQPVWFNDDLNVIYSNLTNDVELVAASGGKSGGGKGKGGQTPGPGQPPKKALRGTIAGGWRWEGRGWR